MDSLLTAHPTAVVAIGSFALALILALVSWAMRQTLTAWHKVLTLEREHLSSSIKALADAVGRLTGSVERAAAKLDEHERRLTTLEVEHHERSAGCRRE